MVRNQKRTTVYSLFLLLFHGPTAWFRDILWEERATPSFLCVYAYPCPEAIDIYLWIVPSGIAIPESCRGIQWHASILKTS